MANKEKMNAEACKLKDEECKVCEDKAEDIDKPEGAEEELAAKEEENADDDMANKYVRLMAEFQNYKKRVSKEKDDLR
ncbi:MAG: nucleotide exchange factor GrpE, partial [[Eubacterium] sulci]|nr:nucleotide exchange factor GrpE [[Eubacterium] sulci]